MSNDFKNGLISGEVVGLIVGLMIVIFVSMFRPESLASTNKLLNSGNYRIDTIIIINNTDTIYKYKFVKIK